MATERAAPTAVERVRTRLRGRQGLLLRGLGVASFLLGWEVLAATQPAYFVPGVGAIGRAFLEQVSADGLVGAYARTMGTVAVGYVIGAVVGIAVGLAMGVDARVEAALDPYVSALYVAPVSALVPLVLLVGGPTAESRVFVVVLFVVFDVIVTTMRGAKTTPTALADLARSFGGGRWTLLRRVMLPHTLPAIFAGLRLGIGRAIKGIILAELLVEFSNLGAILRVWEQTFRVAGVLSVTVLLMVTGIVLTRAMTALRNRVIGWEVAVDGG